MYAYNVEFRVRKGLGPEYVTIIVPVAYDDVDPEVPEYKVKEWAKKDAEAYLRERECPALIFIDIHSA